MLLACFLLLGPSAFPPSLHLILLVLLLAPCLCLRLVCVLLVHEALVMLHTKAHGAASPLAAPSRYDCWAHCRLSCSQLLGDGDHCS